VPVHAAGVNSSPVYALTAAVRCMGMNQDLRQGHESTGKAHVSEAAARVSITLYPGTVLQCLLAVIGVLSLCHVMVNYHRFMVAGTQIHRLYAMLNMDWEGNIPTVFSAMDLLLSALLLCSLSYRESTDGGHWRTRYLGLGVIFLFLACDELFGLHERLSTTITRHVHTLSRLALGTVLLAMVILPLIGVFFGRWLLALPRRIALVMTLSAAIFLAGAVGMEVVSIGYASVQGTKATLMYQMLVLLEEALEMIGIALFNYALLELLCRQTPQVLLRIPRVIQVRLGSRAARGVG
jgi:hypothetical protein